MDFTDKKIQDYSELMSQEEPEVLKELSVETNKTVLNPRMLSGHHQGRFLSLISKLMSPKIILEIGTYTGYSTICMAEGLQKDGLIYTIDNNPELCEIQNRYFEKSGILNQTKALVGNALQIIPEIEKDIDLVFIDADKENYTNYFNLVKDKLRVGGLIIIDNVLWSGKVLDLKSNKDKETKGISNFNSELQKNDQFEKIMMPFRDGVTLAIKIK